MEDAAYLPWLQIRDLRREAGLRRLAVSGGEHNEDDGREIERRIDGRSNWEKGDGGRRADVDGRRRGRWVEIWVCETKEAESVGGEREKGKTNNRCHGELVAVVPLFRWVRCWLWAALAGLAGDKRGGKGRRFKLGRDGVLENDRYLQYGWEADAVSKKAYACKALCYLLSRCLLGP